MVGDHLGRLCTTFLVLSKGLYLQWFWEPYSKNARAFLQRTCKENQIRVLIQPMGVEVDIERK